MDSLFLNQLQRFSVALTELGGRGQECGQFKAMRPLKMLKDMVDGHHVLATLPIATTSHEYQKQTSAEVGSTINARSLAVG